MIVTRFRHIDRVRANIEGYVTVVVEADFDSLSWLSIAIDRMSDILGWSSLKVGSLEMAVNVRTEDDRFVRLDGLIYVKIYREDVKASTGDG